VVDAASVGLGVVTKGLQLLGTAAREIQLVDGFYQAEGSAFKFSKYYYERLWATGRGAPFIQAQEVLNTATTVTPDRMAGFYRYTNTAMEMVYNPTTKVVWHLQPLKK
jgi:filamentous hemagglutinin